MQQGLKAVFANLPSEPLMETGSREEKLILCGMFNVHILCLISTVLRIVLVNTLVFI